MTKGKFYFLSDEYCEKFSKHGVMANKESTANGLHRRPCFYSIQDIKNNNIHQDIAVRNILKLNEVLENNDLETMCLTDFIKIFNLNDENSFSMFIVSPIIISFLPV